MIPKVTIITIIYNIIKEKRVKVLKQCISSVLKQDYKNIEYIVLDGGSHDGTIKFVKKLQKKYSFLFYSKHDTGIYNAMNNGINYATGDYILFLNSDDYFHDKKGISASMRLLLKEKGDFSYASARMIRKDGTFVYNWEPSFASLLRGPPFCHQSLLMKKSILQEFEGFDETFDIAADYDLILRLYLDKKKGVFVPLNFVSFRFEGTSSKEENVYKHKQERVMVLQKNFFVYFPYNNWYTLVEKGYLNSFLFEKIKSLFSLKIQRVLEDKISFNPELNCYILPAEPKITLKDSCYDSNNKNKFYLKTSFFKKFNFLKLFFRVKKYIVLNKFINLKQKKEFKFPLENSYFFTKGIEWNLSNDTEVVICFRLKERGKISLDIEPYIKEKPVSMDVYLNEKLIRRIPPFISPIIINLTTGEKIINLKLKLLTFFYPLQSQINTDPNIRGIVLNSITLEKEI